MVEGDQVAAHSLLTGTHTGDDLFGTPLRQADHVVAQRVRPHRRHQIVERWVSADTLTLFQQIGLLPGGG